MFVEAQEDTKASWAVNRSKLTQFQEASMNDSESLAHTRWEGGGPEFRPCPCRIEGLRL
jgi:hypothetical protein